MNDLITPVIALPDSQKLPVQRMVDFCRRFDGTELKVVPVSDKDFKTPYSHNEFPCRQASSLRTVSLAMKGRPFIWIEPDSPPIKKDWVRILSEEYHKAGKPFMLPLLNGSKFDIASGIGIYSPDTHFLIPVHFNKHGWDYWMLQHLKPMIHFTNLIQHDYGIYGDDGHVIQAHRFPRDNQIIRPETVLFHRDRHQDLLNDRKKVFYSGGDLGDIVAAMPCIRQLGGGDLIIGDSLINGMQPREKMAGKRFEAIKPFLKEIPFIHSVTFGERPAQLDFDFSTFRVNYRHSENLARWQARHVGIQKLDESKWVDVMPSQQSKGRVIVARSPRYHNRFFPWRRIMERYKNKAMFIGLPEEHDAFQREFGTIEYRRTENILEVAELIAGSQMFVGNQSCPAWIAMGLAHPIIMEVWPEHPNSMVVRDNAKFVFSEKDFQ